MANPVSLENFSVNNGSTLPLNFALMEEEEYSTMMQQSVTLSVYGDGLVASWTVDELKYEDDEMSDLWFYMANFRTRDYGLMPGEYLAVVYVNEEMVGESCFDIVSRREGKR